MLDASKFPWFLKVTKLKNMIQVSSCSWPETLCKPEWLNCLTKYLCRISWPFVRDVDVVCLQHIQSQLFRAHAALSPWQGKNALDAAVAAYTNISLLRQQVKPSHRIHGVFEGQDWAVNSELSFNSALSVAHERDPDSSHPR